MTKFLFHQLKSENDKYNFALVKVSPRVPMIVSPTWQAISFNLCVSSWFPPFVTFYSEAGSPERVIRVFVSVLESNLISRITKMVHISHVPQCLSYTKKKRKKIETQFL